jgi:N-methylhydantoinase B
MAKDSSFDPITLGLVKNALYSITDEMMVAIIRTARSRNIKNVLDFSAALLDAQGRMVSIGAGIPLHLGAMPGATDTLLKKYSNNIFPGDVFIMNDPFDGGMHLPDIYIFTPIFAGEELIGFAGTICHHSDVGGRVPGGNASDSTEIYQEGLRIPILKFHDRGKPNDTLFALLEKNIRVPEIVLADLRAQLAACYIAERRLLELVKRYSAENLKRYMAELLNYGERIMRARIATWPDGSHEFSDYIESDGIDPAPIPIKVKVTVQGDSLTIDFTGSSRQVKGAINCTLPNTKSVCYTAVREAAGPEVPSNEGYFRAINVIAEPGSIANAVLPAAVAARALTSQRLQSLVSGALASIIPDRITAASQDSPTGIMIGGWNPEKKPFIFLEFIMGSSGGRPTGDGVESLYVMSSTPAEVVEAEFPIVLDSYGYVPNTGGAGKYRGGLSMERTFRLLADEALLQLRSDRREVMAYGLQGGKPGTPSYLYLRYPDGKEELLPPLVGMRGIKKGSTVRCILAGGGGWGDPLERDPETVLEDVLDEKLTLDYVRNEYGVAINEKTMKLDIAATEKLRQSLQQKRLRGDG